MVAIEGLFQARDRDSKEPIANARKLEAQEEGAHARGEGRGGGLNPKVAMHLQRRTVPPCGTGCERWRRQHPHRYRAVCDRTHTDGRHGRAHKWTCKT